MLCSYQYILQVPLDAMNEDRKLESLFSMMLFQREVETDNEDAEKFSAYSLKTVDGKYKSEEILLYGCLLYTSSGQMRNMICNILKKSWQMSWYIACLLYTSRCV